MQNLHHRNFRGQSLIEGVIVLVLVMSTTIGAIVFLTRVGGVAYYQQKAQFITSQTASFANSLQGGTATATSIQSQSLAFAQQLATTMGLAVNNKDFSVTQLSPTQTQVSLSVSLTKPLPFDSIWNDWTHSGPVTGGLSLAAASSASPPPSQDAFNNYNVVLDVPTNNGLQVFYPGFLNTALPPSTAALDTVQIEAIRAAGGNPPALGCYDGPGTTPFVGGGQTFGGLGLY